MTFNMKYVYVPAADATQRRYRTGINVLSARMDQFFLRGACNPVQQHSFLCLISSYPAPPTPSLNLRKAYDACSTHLCVSRASLTNSLAMQTSKPDMQRPSSTSDLINIDVLVVTAIVSVLVKLDIVIHTLMAVSEDNKLSVSFLLQSHRTKRLRGSTYVSVSLIFAVSGNSPYAFRLLASSALYFNMTSPFSSW